MYLLLSKYVNTLLVSSQYVCFASQGYRIRKKQTLSYSQEGGSDDGDEDDDKDSEIGEGIRLLLFLDQFSSLLVVITW